jgi:CARDB
MKNTLIVKLTGGLFAVGIAASALFGGAGRASADVQAPFLRPDLEVTNLTVEKMPSSNTLYVHFLLKNNGVFQVSQPKYSITVNGQVVDVVQTGVLQGGATIGETVMNVAIPGGGNKAIVEVKADPYNQLNESNELNNSQTASIIF